MTSRRGAWLRASLCGGILACVLAGCGGGHARFVSHLQKGQAYLASGNLDKASVEFRNAAQIEPKNAGALYYNGRVAEGRGNIREAVGQYLGAIELRPDFPEARASLGKLYVFASLTQRALDTIGPGLAKYPNDPDLLAVRAAVRQQQKDDVNALQDAERAHQISPANENAVAILAALYSRKGENDRAISVVSEAVQRVPASVELRVILTNLYLSSGQPERAEEQMHRIIEIHPNDLAPRSQLAIHLVRSHKVDQAQAVLEQAVHDFAKGNDVAKADKAKLTLVDFVSTQRSHEQGERKLRAFVAQDPSDLDLQLGLGALLQKNSRQKEAAAVYEEVIRRDGTAVHGLMARNRIAAIRVSQGQLDSARKLVSEVLDNNPRDSDALILRADIELRANDPAGAIADLRAVLRDQPRSVALQRALARAYVQKGEPALAEVALRAALDAAPDDAPTRVELAQNLSYTSRANEAVALLEEGLRRTPQVIPLHQALIDAYVAKRDLPAASKAAQALVTAHPDSPVGYYLAGIVALQQGHLDESTQQLEHALALKPDAFDTLEALVQVEQARGKPVAALARVQSAIDQGTPSPQAVNLLGQLFLKTKDFQHALEAFTRASSLKPAWWVPERNLAVTRQALSDTEGAIKAYEAALESASLEAPLVVEAALYLEKQGRVDEAISAYRALYAGNIQAQQIAANNLAMLLATYKTDRVSLDQARNLTARFVSSDNGSLLDTSGWVRFKRGEYRDALPVLERASERSPDSRQIRFHLAMTELRLGMTDRARSDLEFALAGSADFEGSDEARSVLAGLPPKTG